MEVQIVEPFENELYNDYIFRIQNSRDNIKDKNNYQEKHHIVPKCMGGSNDKDNLIYLYAQEHYYAHKLLAKENPDNVNIKQAWYLMCHIGENNYKPYQVSAEEFEEARINISKNISIMNTGLIRSEETRKKISEHHADIFGKNNPMYGQHHSEETKEKLRQANIGRVLSEEHKKKISESLKGREVSEKTKEAARKRLGSLTGSKHLQAQKVMCINTGDVFGCAMDAGIWAGLKGKNPGTSIIKSIRHPDKINYAGHVPTTGEPAHWKYIEE